MSFGEFRRVLVSFGIKKYRSPTPEEETVFVHGEETVSYSVYTVNICTRRRNSFVQCLYC
jgi:hypothetical protein